MLNHWVNGLRVEKKNNSRDKIVRAEIKRLNKLMQFVVNDMFHSNYLFKFS